MTVSLYPLAQSRILVAGQAVFATYGPLQGGFITNPQRAADQGLAIPEVLYIDPTGAPAVLQETATTVPLQPGQTFLIPSGQTAPISVNARSAGHRFAGVLEQPPTPYPPVPQIGTFPPSGPVTLTNVLPSYLYQQYADDDDLQAFVIAFNELAQVFVTWFATVPLAAYTNLSITGALLDWVAEGLYGMVRPALGSGLTHDIGPFATYPLATISFGHRKRVGPRNIVATSDDVFKRIMTWNFYKGDGNTFNVRWLKRRVMRFLNGTHGTAPNIDQTYVVSVQFGAGIISIKIGGGVRKITGGAIFGRFKFAGMPFAAIRTSFTPGPASPPLANILQEAVESGVLLFPVQFQIRVVVG